MEILVSNVTKILQQILKKETYKKVCPYKYCKENFKLFILLINFLISIFSTEIV